MAGISARFERIARGQKKQSLGLFHAEEATLLNVPIEEINPDPNQPRRDLGDLDGLKASIAEHGVLQPIVVSMTAPDHYAIIAGERRYTAAKELGLKLIPAIVRTVEEHRRLELQLVENIQRKNLNALEEAFSYKRLMEDYNLTQEELGRRIGKSVASINETLRLLDLPEEVQQDFRTSEKITKSLLLEIVKQPTEEAQKTMWEQAKQGELTVKKARAQKKTSAPILPETKKSSLSTKPTMAFRYPIQTDGAMVTVTFDDVKATPEQIIQALKEALAIEEARLPSS